MYWCIDILVADWTGSIRRGEAQLDNVEDSERKYGLMQVDKKGIDYPIEIPDEAK